MTFIALLIILQFAYFCYSGLIYPDTSRPIEPFRNNIPRTGEKVLSDYTFHFRVQTPISDYPIIRVQFPSLYTTLIVGSTFKCTFTQSSTTVIEQCVVEAGNIVKFPKLPKGSTSFSEIIGASSSLTISDITNPTVAPGTGTGLFSMSTYSQDGVVIDSNGDFGTIGLSAAYTNFTSVAISNDGAPIAGFLTNYILEFQNAVPIPNGSWFRLQFPSGYSFGNTMCSLLGPTLDLSCTSQSDYLYLTGLSQALAVGTYRIRLKNIRNPFSKGDQKGFRFESLREGTNTVIEQSININNITITAGSINSPSVTGSPPNRNLRIDYTISFTPSNTIPLGGCIRIVFPNTFGSLDSTCRIIRGLTASSSGISCTTNSTTKAITISGFTETPPQYIELKIYATNPNSAGATPQFQISTYRTVPPTSGTLIDENLNAGQMTISDVENPYFLKIDVYKAQVNTSLGVTNPLDFRLYPKTALPATPLPNLSKGYGRIWIQLPLWWFGVYNTTNNYVYRCNFATLDSGDSNGCTYSNQIFRMYTPVTKGLEQCDLPISMEKVRITPIPGKWDFRVHTFLNTTIPIEQDLWTMDIPADPFTTASGYSTSLDTQDNDAIIRISFRNVITVPVEGAINLNMSTQQDIYANTAAWDPTLGFTFTGNSTFKQISCRIAIGSTVVGYSSAPSHAKLNCVLFKGNATQNVIIQVRGFSSSLGSSTLISLDIPNIKMCSDIGMNCVFDLTTAYTTALENPYTLNYATINLGTIQGPNNPVLGTVAAVPTFSPTMICLEATYTFKMTLITPLSSGDHILIKFPAAKFTFKRDSVTFAVGSSSGSVTIIYVSETDEIFFLLKLTSSLTATLQTIYLYNVRNSNGELNTAPRVDDFSGVVTKAIYWASSKEIEQVTFGQTASYTNGGIWLPTKSIDYYPNSANDATVTFTRRLNLNDMIPQSISFYVCHKVNSDGGIKISIPMSEYQGASPTCQARSGLTGQSDNNGFTTQLKCVYNNSGFEITGFNEVAQFSLISIGFSLKTKSTVITPSAFNVTTYYDKAFTQLNDYLNLPGISALSTPGPRLFPASLDFVDWLAPSRIARVGTLGTFKLSVTLSQSLNSWTPSNDAHILFKLDSSMGLQAQSRLDCRHNQLVSYYCQAQGSFSIKMPTNQFTGIAVGVPTEVILTTKGAFNSSNYQDGIMFSKAGRYTLTAEAYSGGSMRESSQLEFEVFGKDFLKYWILGINKAKGGINLLRIYITLSPGDYIPASDDPSLKGKIVLEFERSIGKGFASDLGTGIADKAKIPCGSQNLTILKTYSDIECTLYYGLYNNPTKVEITGFNYTNGTKNPYFEIHIPRIVNPNNTGYALEVPKVTTRIYEVNTTTGNSNELFYHAYDLINVTYPQNPPVGTKTITTAPSMNETKLSVVSRLTIRIEPTYTLSKADRIVIQLPLFWKPPKKVVCDVGGNTQCTGYPDANWILVDITTTAITTAGVTATFDIVNPPALLPATAPIMGYYFHEFKLWTSVTYAPVSTSFTPIVINQSNITSPDANYNARSAYTFSFITPEAIPSGGAIRIQIPSAYTIVDTNCENDALGGSAILDTGFQCSLNATSKELTAYGFPALTKNNLIVLKARLDNPNSGTTIGNFVIQTHYIYASTLSTLIAQGTSAPPSIGSAVVSTEQFWDDQYLERDYLYAGDIGPVDFLVNLPSNLGTGDTFIVQIPNGFGLSPEGQPYCLWNNVRASNCVWDSTVTPNIVKISSPSATSLSSNTDITLRLTSLNGDLGKNGLALPIVAGTYTFVLKTSPDGGTTTREMQAIPVTVYAKKFTLFYSTTEIINYNMKTSVKVEFQPESQVPVGGRLILYFPTRNDNGVFLFNDDLRSGVADGEMIPCHDVGSSFGFEPVCNITYGNRQLGLPVQIIVTNWSSPLLTNKIYRFRVNKIMNPPESGDSKHVVMRLESFASSAASSIINAGLHYDFTIQKYDPNVVNAPTVPSTSPMNAAQAGATFNVRFYADQIMRSAARFDYFVLEFPPLIPQPLGLKCISVTNTDCVSLPGNNWVIYDKSDADVPASTYLPTLILNAQQVVGVISSSASVLTSYAVRDRVAITQVIYPAIDYSVLVVQTISATVTIPSITSTQIPYQAPIQFMLSFSAPSGAVNIDIPASGAIEFTLPSTITAIDPFCVNDDTSQMTGDYTCSLSGQIYTITGFNKIAAGTNVVITFWAQVTTASASPVLKLAFYQDSTKNVKIAENTNIPAPAISAYRGFQKLYASEIDALNTFAARTNDIVPFKFFATPGLSFTDPITVKFPSTVSIPVGASLVCGFDNYEAKSCTTSSTSPLTIKIESPHTPAFVASQTYQVFITTFGASSNKKGLLFAGNGKDLVEVNMGTDVVWIPIEIYKTDFTSLIVRPFWSNAAVTNYLAIELQPSTEIPAGGKIVIEFPQFALDGTALFAADLGTSQASGTKISCTSETKSTFIPIGEEIVCTLYYISDVYTTVEISGFKTVTTSSVIEFFIAGFTNPSTSSSDIGHVHLQIHSLDDNGNLLDKRLIEDVFTPQTITPTSLSNTYTRSKNNVQDGGVTYTLSSLTAITGKTISTRSTIIMKFPDIFTIPRTISVDVSCGGTAASVNFKTYANFVVITPTATFPSGAISITLNGVVNPISKDTTTGAAGGIRTYFVYYRSYEAEIVTTANPAVDFTTGTVSFPTFDYTHQITKLDIDFDIELSIDKKIPTGGAIRLTFPSFQAIKEAAVTAGLSPPVTYSTTTSGSNQIVLFTLGKGYSITDGNIFIKISATAPTTIGSYPILVETLQSPTNTLRVISSGSKSFSITTSRTPATSATILNNYIQSSQTTLIQLSYVISTTTVPSVNTTEIQIEIGDFTNAGLNDCLVNGEAPQTICEFNGTTLVMRNFTLNPKPTPNLITFSLQSPSAPGITRLLVSTATVHRTSYDPGIYPEINKTYLDTGSAYVRVYPNPYQFYGFIPAHSTISLPNIWEINLNTGHSPVNSAVLYIEFVGFPTNLGSYSNGDRVPCSSSSHSDLKCTFQAASNYKLTRVRVDGLGNVNANDAISVTLFRVNSPSTASTASVYFRLASIAAGNYEDTIYLDVDSATFSSNTYTTSTRSLTLADYTVRATPSYDLSIPSASLQSGDIVFYHLPYTNYVLTASTPTCSTSCFLYPEAGVLMVPTLVDVPSWTLSISGLNNPPALQSTNNIVAYVIQNGAIGQVVTFTPSSAWARGTFTSVSFKSFQVNTGLTSSVYLLSFTVGREMPSGGILRIYFPLSGFSANPTARGLRFIQGTYTGTPILTTSVVSSTNVYIDISGFTSFSPGPVVFYITLDKGKSSGPIAGSITSYMDSTAANGIETASISLVYDGNARFYSYTRNLFIMGSTNTIKNNNGIWSFTFKQSSATGALSVANRKLKIIPPSTFPFSSSLPIRCKFTNLELGGSYLSQECYKNSFNQYEILPPSSTNSLGVYEWRVTIFTIGSNLRGIPFPATNIRHVFTVNLETDTSAILETNIATYRVFDRIANGGMITSYLNNINQNNMLKLTVTLANSLSAATGKVLVEFPTINPAGTINSNSLYTGLTHRNVLSCSPLLNGFNYTAKCRLLPGAAYDQKPTTIIVEDLPSALSANDQLQITLPIKNGPTPAIWTTARVVTTDSSNPFDLFVFDYVTYTSSPSASIVTRAFPSTFSDLQVQNSVDFTLSVNPSSSVNLQASDTRLRFVYNSNYYGGTSQGVTGHTMELWTSNIAFITFSSNLGSTPVSLSMTGFKNPTSVASFTSIFEANIIKKKVIVATIQYTQTPLPTLTQGSFSSVSVTKDADLRNQVAQYQVTFTLSKDIPADGILKFRFPSGFTLQANTCALIGVKFTSCSISSLDVNFIGVNAVSSGTTLKIIVSAKNPSTSGTTGTFSLYSYDTSSNGIASITTIPGTSITTPSFNKLKVYDILANPKKAQAQDVAPLIFTITLQSNLLKGMTDYMDITFPTASPEHALAPTSILATDLVCRWGDFAASKCQRITNGYRVYTPLETDLNSGSTYVLKITTNRYASLGFTHPVQGSYSVQAKDSKGQAVSKTFLVLNAAFKSAFLVSRITTYDQFTLLYAKFTAKNDIQPQSANNKGQLILEFPTLVETSIDAFPVDLGKGVNNGDPVDCVSNMQFTCKLSKGGRSLTAPTSIILDPQAFILNGTEIELRFGLIKLPPAQKTHTPARLYFRQYNSTTSTWIILEELLKDIIFYTTSSTIDTTQASLTAPVFSPNQVGAPTAVSFAFNLKSSVGTLEPFTYDRLIIYTTTTYIRIQKEGVTSTQANVTTQQIAQWFEVEPTVNLVPSSSFTISFSNWTNVPYVIAAGVKWEILVWKDGNIKQKVTYQNTAAAIPHDFQPTPSVTGYNTKTRAVTTYEISFLPYNKIPAGGSIEIGIPGEYLSLNPQCDIQGLTGASCTVQDDNDLTTDDPKMFALRDFQSYDPAVDGPIKVKVNMVNPKSGGSKGPFTLETKYTGGYSIDRNLNVYYMTIDASATFIDFQLTSLEQLQTKTCGGNPGPMKIAFKLLNSLKYPSEYLTITLDKAFSQPPNYDELLCYFKYNDIYNLKSHRCDWTSNQIIVYAPEEKNFTAGDDIQLTITTRGANVKYQDGISVPKLPGQYFVRVETSNTKEEGYPIAVIPACPFKNFTADSIVWNSNAKTLFNFTMINTAAIPAAASGGRIVVEVPTHNEIGPTFLPDLGKGIPDGDGAGAIGCGGLCVGCPSGNYMVGDTTTYTECTLMKAAGQNFGDRAIIFSTNLQAIALNTYFNFQVARILNPNGTGWPYWTDVRIRTQAKASDGSYVDLNDHWAYNLVPNFLPAVSSAPIAGPAPSMWTSYVNRYGNYSLYNEPPVLLESGDVILYEFFPDDFTLPATIACDQNFNVSHFDLVKCITFNDSQWIEVVVNKNYTRFTLKIYQNMRQPLLSIPVTITGYQIKNHVITAVVSYAPYTVTPFGLEVAMQTPSNTNDVGLTLKYQIGIFPNSQSPKLQYLKLTLPPQWINPKDCVIRRGLIPKDVNDPFSPVQCVITDKGPTIGYYIEIYNFNLGDWWCIIDLTLTNPSTPGYTGTWNNWSFDNYNGTYTNTTRIVDRSGGSDGRTWIGAKPFPNLFRVYRNTISFEDRRAKENEYGEIHMRLIAKRPIPAGTGKLEIWLPDEFDIPNGGDAICEMGNNYHTDLKADSCTITSNRRIYMDANSLSGIDGATCNMIKVTTQNSASGNNGFQTPAAPGNYPFQVYMYNGSALQEYSASQSNVLPDPFTTLSVRVVDKETGFISVVRVYFATPRTIPAGYDTDATEPDIFKKSPIGAITVDFNTLDAIGGFQGWPLNLGFTTSTDIPCKPISGIVAKKGSSNIKCTLVASPSANTKNPARVVVTDFETILEGTVNVEFHLLNLRTMIDYYNNGRIEVGAYQTFGDGSTAQVIQPTIVYQKLGGIGGVYPQVWTTSLLPPDFLSPHTVGSVLIINFPYNTTTQLNAGDIYKVIFPSQFELPDDGSISAVIDGIQLIPYIYNDPRINEIHFEMPAGSSMIPNNTVPETKYLSISQLRDMAYADTSTFTISMWTIKNARRTEVINYSNLPPAPASDFNALSLVLSSLFSGDVSVTYDFTIVPSYHVPTGSTFKIFLVSPLYDHLFKSQPPAVCTIISTDLLTNCVGTTTPGVSNVITFTATTRITGSTRLGMRLTGVKNPTLIGTLSAGSINMQVVHPNGKLINKGNFSQIIFRSPKTPDKISLNIDLTSYFKSVDTDYTFSLQNSNELPVGGKVIMDFPSDWKTILPSGFNAISDLTASFTNQALTYTTKYNSTSGRLEITTQFTWTAKTSLYIKLNSLTNPSNITITDIFRSSTIYDGVTLDETDPLDTSAKITFETPPPPLNVTASSFYPTNEGEPSTYNLLLVPGSDIPAGAEIQFIFPASYGPLLTTIDIDIQCSSPDLPNIKCRVENGRLIVPVTTNVTSGTPFNLTFSGITNPNSGANNSISILTKTGNATLQFTSKAFTVASTSAPKAFSLTKLTTSSTNLQAQSAYEICAQTDQPIPLGAEVYIEFPAQFTFRQSIYACKADNNNLTYLNGVQYRVEKNVRRFIMSGHNNSLPGGAMTSLCYQIDGIENPADSGESNSFAVKVYDPAVKKILYRSYGTLSYPTTIVYKRIGLRILVDTIPDFPIGLESDYIGARLERSVPYEVQLAPSAVGFSFDPAIIYFRPELDAVQKFRIKPNVGTPAGTYFIEWKKFERSNDTRFAAVPDSFFNYVASAAYNRYRVTLGTTVSRTALRGTSLPISVKLTQSPAKDLTVYYDTIKPQQPEYVQFNPSHLVFHPGELEKTFQYTTYDGAISGLILFTLQDDFRNLYYMENNLLNFEILDIDNEPPETLNDYIVTMDRTYMYYRISTTESVWVYYLLTLKGTIPPPPEEIKDPSLRVSRKTKTDVVEITGRNSSYQTSVTKTFIYYDVYLYFSGLEEQTDYVLYYVAEDLSGNYIKTRKVEFTTLSKHHPARFNILLTDDTDSSSLKAAFSLITGITTSRWTIVNAPQKFNIPGNNDPIVQEILKEGTVTYDIMLLQDPTSDEKRPIDTVSLLESNKYLLKTEIPQLVSDYDINKYSFEVLHFEQEFSYRPILVEVTEDYVKFNVSITRNGTLYGIILPKGSEKPTSRQIKNGLNSHNFLVPTEYHIALNFTYPIKLPYGVRISKVVMFSALFDNTEYEAHFTAENDLPVNPDLIEDESIMTVSFLTQRELFIIPTDYTYTNAINPSSSWVLLSILVCVLLLV